MKVNAAYIDKFLVPLIGGADSEDEVEKYGKINPDSEMEVKRLIEEVLLPEFEKRIKPFKLQMKNTLAFYLNNNKIDFESIYDSLLLPIDTPKDSKLFFYWIWEVFFEGENFDFIKDKEVIEEFDIEGPLKLVEMYKRDN